MLPGETVAAGAPTKCNDKGCPGADGPKVCMSAAGYYVGHFCDMCGPYSRESGYYPTSEAAQADLDSGAFGRFEGFDPSTLEVVRLD